MKLADDEIIKAEYVFDNIKSKNYSDDSNKSILTNKRLIVIYNDAEENYPLSKITAVKIKTHSSPILLMVGIFLLVGVFLALFGGSRLGSSEFLIILILPTVLIYLGLRKKTGLIISQSGGEKKYLVKAGDKKLQDFIDTVNHSLS
jgi:hypothetical protein